LVILSDDRAALEDWQKGSADNLYVELTPASEMRELVAFSRRVGLPPVATARAHFLHPRDYQVHRLLRAIADATHLASSGAMLLADALADAGSSPRAVLPERP
jgi:error-prone DNA polymerase